MTQRIQLKNGLFVHLIESHKSPVVSVQMWVKTGSADETHGEEGISHFIEHLVFKGTKKFEVGEVANAIEGSGGSLNAYTSFDETVFYVTISKSFTEMGLEVISEMMGFPRFDEIEIDKERGVVLEEIKRTHDDPHAQASRCLFSTVYKNHPYRVPVIGYEPVIENITREKIVNYFQSRYVPESMNLIIAGDFDSKWMKSNVEKYFGGFKAHSLTPSQRAREVQQTESRIEVLGSQFQETILLSAWKIPDVRHKDIPALDVLSMILGYGDSSRLTRALRVEKPLVNYISSGLFISLDPGFLSISSSLNRGNLKESLAIINSELDSFAKNPPSKLELHKAVLSLQTEDFYSMETVDGLAKKLGFYLQIFGDHEYHQKYLQQIQMVTVTDVMNVFQNYIKPETLSVVLMTPGAQKEDKKEEWKILRKGVEEFQSFYKENQKIKYHSQSEGFKEQSKKPLKWQSPSMGQGVFEKINLKSGARLILRPNGDTPVISMKCAFLGGLRAEGEDGVGLTELLSRTWTAGTEDRSETEIYDEVDKCASSLNAFGGRNSIGLSMTTLSPFWPSMYSLFEETLLKPRLDSTTVEREKLMMLDVVKTRADKPAQEALRYFHRTLFKGHPYSRDLYGDKSTIPKLNSEKLRHFFCHSRLLETMCVVISGAIPDKEGLVDSLNQAIASCPPPLIERPSHWEHEYPVDSQRLFTKSEKEQAHLIMGYPGLTFKDPRKYSLDVLQALLSGQGGRLFIELRDKASLAYSVSTIRLDGMDRGYFGGYIACSPEKVDTAISMMRAELRKLAEEGCSQDELERSKRYLLGRHNIGLQKNSSVVSEILFDELYGLPYDETFQFAEMLSQVSVESLKSLASEIFSQAEILSLSSTHCPW